MKLIAKIAATAGAAMGVVVLAVRWTNRGIDQAIESAWSNN